MKVWSRAGPENDIITNQRAKQKKRRGFGVNLWEVQGGGVGGRATATPPPTHPPLPCEAMAPGEREGGVLL